MTAPATQKKCPTCGATYASDVVFCHNDGAVLESTSGDALVGQVVADRYRIISRIGEGGMGQVYLAEHVHMHRRCAVKFLNPELAGNQGALKRFIREASNASRIDHPNVVTIYDFGEAQGGSVYLSMEFVEGESLRKRIERDGVLPHDIIASVVRQTASALQAAHRLEIVHRDLKPDNIMLVSRDGDMRVKVVDFGIAKARGPEQKVTVTGAIVGTPDYMSPEQVTGDEVDGRSDQYALALVAVKMLTGRLPFGTATSIESLTSRLTSDPLPLRQLRAGVNWPQHLQDVIFRALSASPADRYPSVLDFSRAFDKSIGSLQGAIASTVPDLPSIPEIRPPTRVRPGNPPAPAEPPEPPEPAWREPSRSRGWLVAAGVLLAAGGVGIAVSLGGSGGDTADADSARAAAPLQRPVVEAESTQTPTTQLAGARSDSSTPVQPLAQPRQAGAPTGTRGSRSAAPAPVSPQSIPRADAARGDTTSRTVQLSTVAEPRPAARDSSKAESPDTGSKRAATTPESTAAKSDDLLSETEVTNRLAIIRRFVNPDAPPAALAGAVTRMNEMLPRIAARHDSLRVLYVRAQAEALQGEIPAACRTLGDARALARGSDLEATLARTAARLNCP